MGHFSQAKFQNLDFVGGLVVAGLATGGTVIKAVVTEPHFELRLAVRTILFTNAIVFLHLALHAVKFGFGGGHSMTVTLVSAAAKFP